MKTCVKCGLSHTNSFSVCSKCNEPLVPVAELEEVAERERVAGRERERSDVINSTIHNNGAVVISDINMPFGSMVVFMVKWSLASIPAFLILLVIGAVFFGLFGGFLGAFLR